MAFDFSETYPDYIGSPEVTPEQQEFMRKAVERMTAFMTTYTNQLHYEDYRPETFIHDVLYGLAVSLDEEKYQFADGYRKFQEDLAQFLLNDGKR